jgi:hypothetical protein
VLGAVVAETERPIEHVFFPHIGVISLVVEMEGGDMIETAMVGRWGYSTEQPRWTATCPCIVGLCRWRAPLDYQPRCIARDVYGVRATAFSLDKTRAGAVRGGTTISWLQREPQQRSAIVALASANARSCPVGQLLSDAGPPRTDAWRATTECVARGRCVPAGGSGCPCSNGCQIGGQIPSLAEACMGTAR